MGYTPNLPARSLVTRDTATIGLAVSFAADPFLSRLVRSIEEMAQDHGYKVFISQTYLEPDREREGVRAFHEHRARGVIVVGSRVDLHDPYPWGRFNLPVVITNCREYPFSVSSDNEASASSAVQYLTQLGHRNIAYIANKSSPSANNARSAGYQRALEDINIIIDERYILESDGTLHSGLQTAQHLLSLTRPPTAVFCFNDMVAMGVLEALRRAGVLVPQQMSVVGFDDVEFASFACPPLTTVRQRTARIGRQAVKMLFNLIHGQQDVAVETLAAELVIRQTTGPAPVAG